MLSIDEGQGRPNVAVVMMDDLAWGDIAAHGNPIVRTPRLDDLRGSSTRLTRYLSGPLCTPARASLMTGRHHQRTRAIDTFCGRAMIDPAEHTMAEVLAAAGYRTGAFGKWHLGDNYPMRPQDMGFQETLVHRSGGIGSVGDHRDNACREGEAYFDPVLLAGGEAVRTTGYCTDVFTDAAIDFVTRAGGARPWFVLLATNAPHTPLEVPGRWIEHYRQAGVNETHARLYAMVENIDWNVGRLVDALDATGQSENTVVLYTSDHGPCPSARDFLAPPHEQQRWNDGLRGEKGSLYQGGLKVPCFWRWPGHIPAGVDVGATASPIDVLPTLCGLTRVPAPEDRQRPLDGIDLSPVLLGEAAPDEERTLVMQWHRGDVPVRYRNYAVVSGRFKLTRPEPQMGAVAADVADELYDLVADPGEATDLAPERADLVEEMRRTYEAWFLDVGGDDPERFAPHPIVIGSRHEPVTTLSRQDWRIDPAFADLGEVALWRTADLRAEWRVHIDRAGAYDVQIRLEPWSWKDVKFFSTVHLRVGSERWQVPWAPMCSMFDLGAVELGAGVTTIEAWAEGPGDSRQAALYVDLAPASIGG